MPKGTKRRTNERYEVFDAGDKIPLPDYSVFSSVCKEAAAELGMDKDELIRLYKRYVDVSLELMFPEGNPRNLPDEALLSPRRIIRIPGIVTAEVTERSLHRWRKIEEAIRNKRERLNNMQDNNTKTE